MKILPALLTYCCIGLLCFSLTACSSHTKKSALHKSGGSASSSDSESDEISSSEPEETAREELEALNRPGAWEYGLNAHEKYSLEQAGIDPSKYDFPIALNKQVLYYLELFQGKQRNYFTQWLARSTAYRPYIEAELKKAGLPRDLVFLAMIESGYNPSAYSPADACGLWQFLEGTGRDHGLKVDAWVDERREPEKATKAAIRYLSRLHAQFDDWYLAVAAYNAGEGRIDNAITTYNTKDFWEIAASEGIFLETKRYVPKLIAAIIIGRNPEKFGFTDVKYQEPSQYETVKVPGGVDLEAVAVTANTSSKQLRSLNNELRKNQTPPKSEYLLRVPVGAKDLIAANLDKLRPVTRTVYATHTVKKGETLTTICSLYNINKTTLLKANNLRTAQLKNGLRLQIPTTSTKYVLLKDGEQPEALAGRIEKSERSSKTEQTDKSGTEIVRHQLKSGETVASVAKQYQVSVRDILKWNKLANQAGVKKGQQLAIQVKVQKSAVVVASAKSGKPTEEKTAAQIPTLEASMKRSVAKGETVQQVQKNTQPQQPQATVAKTSNSVPAAQSPATAPAAKDVKTLVAAKKSAPTVIAAKETKAAPEAKQTAAVNTNAKIAKTTSEAKPAATAAAQQKTALPTWYVVKNGDTLAAIAKKFQTSPQDLRAWNKLSDNTVQTGGKLLVKKG